MKPVTRLHIEGTFVPGKNVVAILFLIVLLCSCTDAGNQSTLVPSGGQNMPTFERSSVTQVVGSLLYPDAQNVETEDQTPVTHHITFTTPDVLEQVKSYYEGILPQRGWTELRTLPFARFSWTDPEHATSWHFDLSIVGEVLQDGSSKILLEISRWPDPKKLPIPNDAQALQAVSSEQDSTLGQSVVTTTTSYVSSLTLEQLQAFYVEKLLQDGWQQFPRSDSNQTPAPQESRSINNPEFVASHFGVNENTLVGMRLSIVVKEQENRQLQVLTQVIETETTVGY